MFLNKNNNNNKKAMWGWADRVAGTDEEMNEYVRECVRAWRRTQRRRKLKHYRCAPKESTD